MLKAYIRAESLKARRSLFRRLTLLIPVIVAVSSAILIYVGMSLGGFAGVMACNWCMPLLSLSAALLCRLANQKERQHQYRTLYSLPVDLKKVFLAKAAVASGYLLLISLLLSLVTAVSVCLSSGVLAALRTCWFYCLSYFLLWLSCLWQIPFGLFLDQKLGSVGFLIFTMISSAISGLFLYLAPFFWLFPYSWSARFLATLFGLLTNGLPAGERVILSPGGCLLLALVSLLFALVLTAFFASWYERRVERK